jgi:hypothetical protein
MSIERLALFIAGALILVSAVGIAYLTAEQAGAAKRTDIQVDAVPDAAPTMQTIPRATDDTSTTRVAPRPLPSRIRALEPSSQGGLRKVSKATAHALVGGAFGAGSLALARNGTERADLGQRGQ